MLAEMDDYYAEGDLARLYKMRLDLYRIRPFHTCVKELERIDYFVTEQIEYFKGYHLPYDMFPDRLRGKNKSSWGLKNGTNCWATCSEQRKEETRSIPWTYLLGPGRDTW